MIDAVALELAVQIVNYRTQAHLGACIRSALEDLRDGPLEHRVLVLDNASGDDLTELASAHREEPVEFHTAERNLGFGAGHNRLAELHHAAVLLLLNPDARLVVPGTAAALYRLLAEPGVAAAGPRLEREDGGAHGWDHGDLRGARARFATAAGHSHARAPATRTDVAWVSGACVAISRPWFEVAGGFDPGFFLYKEEEDLLARMRGLGARVVYDPSLRVLHHESVTGVRSEHLAASVRRYRDKHVRTRLGRAVLPPLYREAVSWEGRLRRARSIVRARRP
jgi:N-acetylglucosaminyl-diphospho-decaprenol L-rhamnosyltransferase